MIRHFFILLLFFGVAFNCASQQIKAIDFEKLRNKKRILYFNDKESRYYGCGMNLDCMGLNVRIKTIHLDKVNKKLYLELYINPTSDHNDTIGTNIFRLFLAQPLNGKLTKVHTLIDVQDTVKFQAKFTQVDLKTARVKTEFAFEKPDRLYIESTTLYGIAEYDISTLLK